MTLAKSWQFIGSTEGIPYRFYDWMRRGVNARLVRFLVAELHDEAPAFVLEAGSGTAHASTLMAKEASVSAAVCLDIDFEALSKSTGRSRNVFAVVGDINRMPFSDDTFALVFNNSTVEHFDEPVHAIREMRRVCRESGRVFVGVPYARGPLCFEPFVRNSKLGVWLGRVFTERSLDETLSAAGLTPLRHLRFFLRFFVGALSVKHTSRSVGTSS